MLVVMSQEVHWINSPSEDDWAFLQKARDLLNALRQATLEPLDVDGHRLSLLDHSLTGLKEELDSRKALESPFGHCAKGLSFRMPKLLDSDCRFEDPHEQLLPMGTVILFILY